jgi:hypothetical protein
MIKKIALVDVAHGSLQVLINVGITDTVDRDFLIFKVLFGIIQVDS